MNILQFIASSGWGGAEQSVVELSNSLAKSHDVTALVMRDCEFSERFSNSVKIVPLKSHGNRRNPFLLVEISKLVKDIQPDVVHTHAAKASELIHTVGKFTKLKHVATKHNDRPGRIFDKIRMVTAVSELAASTIASVGNRDVKVIYNCIEPKNPGHVNKESIFTIMAAGRLDAVKGFDILIRAVRELSFDYQLIIFGEGPERKNLQGLIDSLSLNERVSLAGFSDKIPEKMKSSHLVVVSSHSEGFGRVLIESLFYADAVLSTRVGIASEILPIDLIVDQSDFTKKIRDVFRNYEDYKNSFRQIRDKAGKKFLLSEISREYVEFYRD